MESKVKRPDQLARIGSAVVDHLEKRELSFKCRKVI
jgi:hypothetical protein